MCKNILWTALKFRAAYFIMWIKMFMAVSRRYRHVLYELVNDRIHNSTTEHGNIVRHKRVGATYIKEVASLIQMVNI